MVCQKAGCLVSGRFAARAELQKSLASQCPGPLSIWDGPLSTPAFRRRGVMMAFWFFAILLGFRCAPRCALLRDALAVHRSSDHIVRLMAMSDRLVSCSELVPPVSVRHSVILPYWETRDKRRVLPRMTACRTHTRSFVWPGISDMGCSLTCTCIAQI